MDREGARPAPDPRSLLPARGGKAGDGQLAATAEEPVFAPAGHEARIDLQTPGEPWEKRRAAGKALRPGVPHADHAVLNGVEGRPDFVSLIRAANKGRQEHLVPLRMARMAESPFAVRPAHAPFVPVLPEPCRTPDGVRAVRGQRLLQSVGDPLLGWTTIDERPFDVRRIKSMKGEVPPALLTGRPFLFFAGGYGALLARAHARTGDAAAIFGYHGGAEKPSLDEALGDWAEAYGNRNERDHAALVRAMAEGQFKG